MYTVRYTTYNHSACHSYHQQTYFLHKAPTFYIRFVEWMVVCEQEEDNWRGFKCYRRSLYTNQLPEI